MLTWIDLETTGLDAIKHTLLEVAAIVTDDQLQEVDRFHRVIHWKPAGGLAVLGADSTEDQFAYAASSMNIDRVIIELHTRSGLWAESALSTHTLTGVDVQLADFIARASIGPEGQRAQIAGSSIWLDRSFMSVHLPRALGQLHYRCVDVTTMNELARRFWPRLHQGIPRKRGIHRAMPDIEDSLELCRYYTVHIAKELDSGLGICL